jgi:outer membrane protein OmpA-like peptidoglycan-associated protein
VSGSPGGPAGARAGEAQGRAERVEATLETTQGRVGSLETAVGEVGRTAEAARSRADEAVARADALERRVATRPRERQPRVVVDTLHVLFPAGGADLDDPAQTALLPILAELRKNPSLTVEVYGYTDPSGPLERNLILSRERAEAVRRFLAQRGVELQRIHAVGLGPAQGGAARNEPSGQRRATLKLMLAPD